MARRRDLYLGTDGDAWLVVVIGADGKKLEGVIEARPLWQELVFRVPASITEKDGIRVLHGPFTTQIRKMPFTLVNGETGAVIDDRAAR